MTTEILDTRTEAQRACFVQVNKLIVHPDNVRRTDKRADIEALAASILAHGLLQNLSVVRAEDGRYAVIAGARRLAALKLLIKRGSIARDFAAPCTIVEPGLSAEASLAENIQRVAMNAMDEMEAFAKLADEGMSADAIAERFGAQVRHVEQRLALGRLSPKLRSAYRKGDLTLDAARAFCLTDDQAAQERVFKQFQKPVNHGPSVRNALANGRMAVTDRLARFVGAEAYEAAGGRIVRDLFEEDIAFLEDGELVQRLAAERIEAVREALAAEGWGWTEALILHGQIEGCATEKLRPRLRELSAEENETIADLEAEIEALDKELEADRENDALWDAREAASDRLDALREAAQSWDPEEMALGGAVVSIDRNGEPVITRGLIKRSDVKALTKLRKTSLAETDCSDDDVAEDVPASPALPKAIVERLTSARTRALRSELARAPHVALALLVFTLLRRSHDRAGVPGLAIESCPIGLENDEDFERERAAICERFAKADLGELVREGADALLMVMATLVAETLDVAHEGASSGDQRTQGTADALAAALDLDISRYWQASVEFWEKAPKAFILDAIETAPALAQLSDATRKAKMKALAKMKRGELARVAHRQLEGWLPDCLITPPHQGAFAVTETGEAALDQANAA